MRVALTDQFIRGLRVAKRTDVADVTTPGLVLRASPPSPRSPAGARVFVVQYGARGRKRYRIGPYPKTSLKAAREATPKILARATLGDDPQAEKVAERRRGRSLTVRRLVERFVATREDTLLERTVEGYKSMARRLESLGPAAAAKRGDVRAVLDRMAKKSPVASNRFLRILKSAYRWGVAEELVDHDPVTGIRPRPEDSHHRELTEDEIRALWNVPTPADAAKVENPESEEKPTVAAGERAFARVLLICGTRRTETALARWGDIDFKAKTWTIPPEHRKGQKGKKRQLVVALPDLALRVLREAGEGKPADLVFGAAPGAVPDRVVKHLRAASGVELTFHDLRVTFGTGLARCGVPPWVVAHALDHSGETAAKSGLAPAVTAVYSQTEREPEVRSALRAWASRLEAIVSGRRPGKVVAWRR
jgi:integrase